MHVDPPSLSEFSHLGRPRALPHTAPERTSCGPSPVATARGEARPGGRSHLYRINQFCRVLIHHPRHIGRANACALCGPLE